MTYQQALVYANKLCKGFPFTARQKALKEYNELCKNLIEEKIKLIEEKIKLEETLKPKSGRYGYWQASGEPVYTNTNQADNL